MDKDYTIQICRNEEIKVSNIKFKSEIDRFRLHSNIRIISYDKLCTLTLATANSKSSCVTCTLLSLRAYMPASVHTPWGKEV